MKIMTIGWSKSGLILKNTLQYDRVEAMEAFPHMTELIGAFSLFEIQ